MKRGLARPTLLALLGLTVCTTLVASGEEVVIRTVVHDKAILVRKSQELHMIQTTTHCRSLAGYQGKTVFLLYAANHSLDPGSHLLLRNPHRRCRILHSVALDGLSDSKARSTSEPLRQSPALLALQGALLLLGQDPGTIGEEAGTMRVLNSMRQRYGYDASIVGLKKTVRAIALRVISKNARDARAVEVGRKLLNMAFAPESPVVVPGA